MTTPTAPPIDLHAIRRDPHYKRFKAAMRRIAKAERDRIRAERQARERYGEAPEPEAA